jgi:uncharacterized protein (TIGR02466 family)
VLAAAAAVYSPAAVAFAKARAMQIDVLKSAAGSSGVSCFSIVRNELYFLPHFLRHYRQLGVGHFIFYDDKSEDGTRDLLLSQPDCTLLGSDHSFQQPMADGKPFHYHARTLIPERFAPDRWCLTVDADEFLFLPEPFSDLVELIAELETRGHICALAPMVDFYPERLSLRNYSHDLGPFEGCHWWFDRDPGFERHPLSGVIRGVPRGVRVRLMDMLLERDPSQEHRIFGGEAQSYARLWKVPLLKTGRQLRRVDTHSVNAVPPTDIQLALAHFKFVPSTDAKVRDALERKSYFAQSREYRFIEAALELLAEDQLTGDESVRFESSKSLEQAGLLFAVAPGGGGLPAVVDQLPARGNEMGSKSRIETLFATPVILSRLADPELIAELERTILGRRAETPGVKRSNLGGWHSDDELFDWGGEPAQRLLSQILSIASAHTEVKARPGVSFEWQAYGWANINESGASNAAHAHPGCFWSAVFYVRVDPGEGGELLLHDPRLPGLEMYAPELWLKGAGVQRQGSVKPKPGLLILFPSWLLHSVQPWFGEGLRISVAVNLRANFSNRASG